MRLLHLLVIGALVFAPSSTAGTLLPVKKAIAEAARVTRQSSGAQNTSVLALLPQMAPASNGSAILAPHYRSALKNLPPMFCITCWQTPERTRLARQHFRQRPCHPRQIVSTHRE